VTGTPWPVIAAVGAAGLIIGSFISVVIYRVPREESIVFPGSHCPCCQTRLKPWHNIPVLSWLLLGGHCRYCKAPISLRYPLVEAGTAAIFAGITWRFGLSVELPAYLYFAAVGVTLAMIDFDVRRLPDSILLPSYIVSAMLLMPAGAAGGDWMVAARAFAGMAALAGIYLALAIAYPHMMDFGDVKLAGLIGLYLGWLSWPAVLVGAFGGLALAGFGGRRLAANRHDGRGITIAFGPCMVAAAGLALFVTVPAMDWYTSLLTAA
jgi:leader peptidase (prepilin peptidase)/N-methyltransferase